MKRIFTFLLLILIFPPVLLGAGEKTLTIIHTNDLHSYILSAPYDIDNPFKFDKSKGGWARIAAVIKKEKQGRKNTVLTFDAGDFLWSDLLRAQGIKDEYALILMKRIGYDVVTLGNHEFDSTPKGLAGIITKAGRRDEIPQIVFSNAIFSDKSRSDDSFKKLFDDGFIKESIILERAGIRIGVFGIIGRHAVRFAFSAFPVRFKNPVETSSGIVERLRKKEGADIVVCLSHSGVNIEDCNGEDEILANRVKGIDVIISGHSHTLLRKPKIVNGAIIVQAGEFGKYVGVLDIVYDKTVKVKKYRIIDIDARTKEDKRMKMLINSYIK